MVRFTKMEGLGNDYIYIDNFAEKLPESDFPALSRAVSDRHFGIGADGLIVIMPPQQEGHDFTFRMYNADGSEGEMCGNGIRCFARFVYDRGLTKQQNLTIDTRAGTIRPMLQLDAAGQVSGVRVDMGQPRLQRGEIPMAGAAEEQVLDELFSVGGQEFRITAVSMGNPHVMIFVPDPDAIELEKMGPQIEHHPAFPRRTNVHFVQVVARGELKMRTWERGSGITLACGTGASAVLVAAHRLGLADREALIHLPGGDLRIEWAEDNHIYMTGPATEVCTGTFSKPY